MTFETENGTQLDYRKRINKVFQYIDEHLATKLSLETIAEIAHFSPFHFHRIFRTITGETLNEYVTRQRIEKAALAILNQRGIDVATLAHQYGFNSHSAFTRAFKNFYGVSPTEFKKQNPNKFSKIRQLDSKNSQGQESYEKYICLINQLKEWTIMNANIEIKEMPKLEMAYIQSIGIHQLEGAFQRLVKWATPKGLLEEPAGKIATIYRDSFKVTEPSKVRISACVILDKPVEVEGEVGLTSIDPGKCIKGSYEIGMHEFEKSWTGLFLWMNENGYQKADICPFEIYHNHYSEHPENKFIVDFYIPVK